MNMPRQPHLLTWLGDHGTTLNVIGPGDIEDYLTGATARYQVRDFLHWAAASGHTHPLTIPTTGRTPGKAAASSDERWAQIARLLHDDTIQVTDRVAGSLLLLYGQQLSRIAALTLDQLKTQGPQVFLCLGRDDLHIPEPLVPMTALAMVYEHVRGELGARRFEALLTVRARSEARAHFDSAAQTRSRR